MISAIEWIPRGIADPNPKKYKLSKKESEFLERVVINGAEESNMAVSEDIQYDNDDDDDEIDDEITENGNTHEHLNATLETNHRREENIQRMIQALPTVDPSTLPPELRMSEYSDDEDDLHEHRIGQVLLGSYEINPNHQDLEDLVNVKAEDDGEEDDDDSLQDVPDTREFIPTDVKGLEAMRFSGYTGIADYEDHVDDDEDMDDDSDIEDTNLRPDDALILVAKTEEDFASLEIHVYEESSGNLFVHHDIPLPSYPLCLAHGTINSDGQAGNYVAVGSFHPGIEIWNLDILDVLEPECILGGEDTTHLDDEWKNLALGIKPKKGKNTLPNRSSKGPTLRRGSHKDAVMSLSWNPIHRQVIASGSADKTVKLWDITQQSSMDDESNKMNGPYTTWTHHKDKVQSLAWHPTEGTILASGSYDRSVCVIDARTQDGSVCKRAKIPADCEAIAWDPHHPHLLTAASEDGTVLCWDVRNFGKNHYWSFVAHEFGGCSDISYNAKIPGMLASCAIDKTVAIWDTMNIASGANSPTKPISCGSKDMCVGKLYSVSFYSDSPWLLGCGGSGNELALWDLSSDSTFVNRFSTRIGGSTSVKDPESLPTENVQEEDFEAKMARDDQATAQAREGATKQQIKKKKSSDTGRKKVIKKVR